MFKRDPFFKIDGDQHQHGNSAYMEIPSEQGLETCRDSELCDLEELETWRLASLQ